MTGTFNVEQSQGCQSPLFVIQRSDSAFGSHNDDHGLTLLP
jgi:hypothetical protein